MKAEQNKMVGVDYKLTVDGAIADQSRPGQPLEFIFGTGMLLPKFEEAILGKEPGEKVSFTLEPKDGYGEVIADAIVDLPKNIFMVDGKLAEDILFVGSQVPMSDNQGNRMMGIVKGGRRGDREDGLQPPDGRQDARLRGGGGVGARRDARGPAGTLLVRFVRRRPRVRRRLPRRLLRPRPLRLPLIRVQGSGA